MYGQKGIVMEIGKDWTIVLLENGDFKEVRSAAPLQVGQIYQDRSHFMVRYAVAAVVLLSIIAGTLDYFSVKAYAEISSLADIGVNRWGRVISVTAVSDKGQNVLKTTDLQNDQLDQAVEKIVTQGLEEGITPSEVQGTVRGEDYKNREKLLQQVNQGIDKAYQKTDKDIPQTKNINKSLTHKELKNNNNNINGTDVQTSASWEAKQGSKEETTGDQPDNQNPGSSLDLSNTTNADKTQINQKENSNQTNEQKEQYKREKKNSTIEKAHKENVNKEKEKWVQNTKWKDFIFKR